MTCTKVEYEQQGPVAHVTLNRPEKLNAIDWDCLDAIEQLITRADRDMIVRAVVISGRGRCFSAGADLDLVEQIAPDQVRFDEFLQHWHRTLETVERCGKPTIAAVHGFALAGGFELTQACDFLVVGAGARIGDQHANFGLFPGGGSAQRLPRAIGRRLATWMLVSGEPIDAATAASIGLANRVVADDDVIAEAHQMALLIAERSMVATRAIKNAISRGAGKDLAAALAIDRQIAAEHITTPDARAGLVAFRNRSRPNFGYLRDDATHG